MLDFSNPKSMCEKSEPEIIQELNDEFRTTCGHSHIVLTYGVLSLANGTIGRVINAIREYDEWEGSDDLRDFGEVERDGHKVWFKIDYFGNNLLYASPNPADPDVTKRVMTVLLPNEYEATVIELLTHDMAFSQPDQQRK